MQKQTFCGWFGGALRASMKLAPTGRCCDGAGEGCREFESVPQFSFFYPPGMWGKGVEDFFVAMGLGGTPWATEPIMGC